jgi:hypothetical protein
MVRVEVHAEAFSNPGDVPTGGRRSQFPDTFTIL